MLTREVTQRQANWFPFGAWLYPVLAKSELLEQLSFDPYLNMEEDGFNQEKDINHLYQGEWEEERTSILDIYAVRSTPQHTPNDIGTIGETNYVQLSSLLAIVAADANIFGGNISINMQNQEEDTGRDEALFGDFGIVVQQREVGVAYNYFYW